MYVVANRVPVAAEWHDAFEERFRARAGQVDLQPGFVRMEILRPDAEDGVYVVLTHWQDKAAFENWVGSDDFKIAHQNPLPKEAFTGPGELERHTAIIVSEKN
jgi:heme oxygenase (mycobilin-producing)